MSKTYVSGGDDFDIDLSQFELSGGHSSYSAYQERYSPPLPQEEDFLPRSTTGKRNPLPSKWSPPTGISAPRQHHHPLTNGRPSSPNGSVVDRMAQVMLAPRSPPRNRRAPERNKPPNQYQSASLERSENHYKSSPNLYGRSPSPSDAVVDNLMKSMLAPSQSPPQRRKPMPQRQNEPRKHSPAIYNQVPDHISRQSYENHYNYHHPPPPRQSSMHPHEKKHMTLQNGRFHSYYQNESNRHRHQTTPNYPEESSRDDRGNARNNQQLGNPPTTSTKSKGFIPKPPPRPPTPPQNPQPKPTKSSFKNAFHTLQPSQRPRSSTVIPPPPPPAYLKPQSHTMQRPKDGRNHPLSPRQRALTYHPQRPKHEAIRLFLPFDPKAPSTPIPDYEGDAKCVYIPPPDY